MLIHLLLNQPQAALAIVQYTPSWVWGLLAGLILLGSLQLRTRQLGLGRAFAPAIGLALFSLIGLAGDLAGTRWLPPGLIAWLTGLGLMLWMTWYRAPGKGTVWDPASSRFIVPGSVAPLLTILAIFLIKYGVGIELAMQPELRQDAVFSLVMAAGYGALTGFFASRPLSLWRLANVRPHAATA